MSFRKRSLVLAIVNAAAGMTLLLLSSWFIAACAMAGSVGVLAGFNYVVPAALIRFLAVIRITSGYFDKNAGHLHLLSQLHTIRKKVLIAVFSKDYSVNQADTGKTLEQTTEQLASAWAATYNPVISSLTIASAFSLLFVFLWPALLTVWVGYLVLILALSAAYLTKFRQIVIHENNHLADFLNQQHRWLNQHTLWPLTQQTKTMSDLLNRAEETSLSRQKQSRLSATFEHTLLLVSLVIIVTLPTWVPVFDTALVVVPFFILLSVKDWLFPMLHGLNQNTLRKHQAKSMTRVLNSTNNNKEPQPAAPPPVPEGVTLVLEDFCWQRGSNTEGLPVTATCNTPGLYWLSGATGLGKSSTFDALCGELDYKGRLLINGVDSDKRDQKGRSRLFHYAQQFGHVFSDTLQQNLIIANPKATEAQLTEALSWAELPQWAFKEKLNMWLGPEGLPISGGEQKRLLLARAFLSKAPIWLLDEPFEGLDTNTNEKLIQKLNAESKGRIILLASHIKSENLETVARLTFSSN